MFGISEILVVYIEEFLGYCSSESYIIYSFRKNNTNYVHIVQLCIAPLTCLDLAINNQSKLPQYEMRAILYYMLQIIRFFRESPKRRNAVIFQSAHVLSNPLD